MIRKRTAMRVLAAVGLIILGLITALASSSSAGPAIGLEIHHGSRVAPAVFVGSVHALPQRGRSADRAFPAPRPERETALGSGPKQALPGAEEPPPAAPATRTPAPDPSISFKGLDFNAWGDGWPPDTVGDVGPTQFVQAVNTSVGIFRKSDGVRLAAFTFDALWSAGGAGTPCHANNYGDPTVVYDPQSDRWIVADFSFAVDKRGNPVAPYYECIAVSKTSDPVNGGWYLYAIRTDDATHPWFADYPKMGIWPDGLYMTANMFDSSGSFKEVRVWAFNRGDLESGVAARNVVVDLATTAYFSLLPSNMRTATGAPPAGRPNLLIAESESAFAFEVWKFHVDYSGSGSTFTGPTNVSQAAYSVASGSVVTPGNAVDTLEDRLMMQAQYTNIGGVESVWVNHTVGCCGSSTPVGIQWAQINVTGGTVKTTPVQQQEYPPANDDLDRWMGSLAVDRSGDMALGYSVANATTNPDIRYAGRLSSDPLNTLPQTETSMLGGVTRGTQDGDCGGSVCTRWGDYSAMSIDPDGCRFWYTQEYYETTGVDWQTRIGSFSFPSCSGKTAQTITFAPLAAKTFGDADFTVSATASSGLPVSFSAGGNCTVAGSTVHITGAGSCTITASQAGDSTYAAAPDVARTFSIAKANQTVTFGALAGKTYGDPDFTVSATASSGLAVSFAPSGNCTLSGATVHLTGAGSCTITASQAGNANYNAATDVPQTFSIAKADQSITFGPLADKTYGDPDFGVTATASSGLAVTFAGSGNCTVAGSTVHITGAGSCTVTASQGGNSNYNAALDVSRTFSIAKASQTIAFPAITDKAVGDADFDPGATASSGLAVGYAASGSCTIVSSQVHITGFGSCTVTASQAGDANYLAAADVARSFAIKSSQTITFGALPAKTFGDPDFAVSASASSGLPVSFASGGNCTVSGVTVHITGAGSCTVTASQAGDSNYLAAPDVSQGFSIAKAAQSIAFGALAARTYGDSDFTVAATASSGLPVSFVASGNCTVAGVTVHLTGAGSCTLTASQPGNTNYNAAPDVPQSFAIAKASQSISFAALAGRSYGDADFAVSASASSGLTVAFTATGSCTVGGSTAHITGAGSCSVTAHQAGDANYNAAADVPQTFAIAKAAQTISFGALGGKTFGDPDFAVGATASSGLPVGFVGLGDCAVAGSTVGMTGAGSCTVTATQAGDANYNAAVPLSQTFAIAKAGQTITFGPLADRTYGDADFTVAATASSGLAVSFAAAGSCTIAGVVVHLTGAGSCMITASQAGSANHSAAPDEVRSFTIGSGPLTPAGACKVPRVVGKSLAAARLALKQRHCRRGKVGYAYSRKSRNGIVVSQSRRPGRVLPAGSKVDLVVSHGRKP